MSWFWDILATTPPAPPAPDPAVVDAPNEGWDWKTYVAVWGAVTGSYGAVVSTLGRRDVRWRRAAKQVPTVRPALIAMRDAVAECRNRNRTLGSLREVALRGHLEELQENKIRISDSKLSAKLTEVEHSYTALIALGDDAIAHRRTEALSSTADAIGRALDRVALIDRKAPP